MESLIYVLAAIGLVALAYFLGGPKYAGGAGVAALAILYVAFGKQASWTDAWEKADEKLKKEDENLKEKQKQKEEDREKTDEKIEDSKKKTEDLKDQKENVEENTPEPDGDAENLKDWVESFG